ncbi:MAG: hypothetical protein L0I80_05300 [Brevibacterium sp.]|nr:hypothetical protein [Brevibacterium sp.]MDN6530103.1 hypothetical protein [Brevibacterium sp.]
MKISEPAPLATRLADPLPLGIATAVVAWYASFAGVTNETFGRQVIPMG